MTRRREEDFAVENASLGSTSNPRQITIIMVINEGNLREHIVFIISGMWERGVVA
jgi:hypothetical protein